MESVKITNEFPTISLCPKRETGVSNFLIRNPDYDGRGIVIAIFDSGVDPGANGLRETTTGLPKIIERYDCSGAGDCDTSTIVKPSADGTITGLSGRKLKIPTSWINPTEEYHVGVKPVFELYTPKVKERIEAKRRELYWDPQHRHIQAEANRVLTKEQALNKSNDSLTPIEKLAKEDLEAQVEVLQNLDKKYKDLGPLLDCVVFHTGSEWKICLADDGNLDSGILLTEYKINQSFAPLTQADQMNISVNVWENGNRLEIVGLCSSHGSHVSGIAAGYFPENPDLNGVAPGAQIISFTIGDGRLGSMETGQALVRAMCFVMQNSHRIHLINMSYGEHAHWSASSRIGELMKEVVDKHGVIWVASGGNHGPALSTVGTPPWIMTNSIIGVAAYVSPDMMQASYSLREKLPSMPYTWSSRGPTLDGDLGISVCAPGGAITSVPNFTLRSVQLMNGTSMAAPHLAGCIGLMLCGAVARNFKWTPYSVKKALENTAQPLANAEPYAQGKGLVQVEKAFESLETLSKLQERDVKFNVTVNGGSTCWPMRGIYIRDPPPDKAKEYSVGVEPSFFNEDEIEPETKINFRMNLCLVSDAPWVQVPQYFDLANMVRNFNIKVDPEGLPYGLNSAKIQALDVNDMGRGPVFEVCVTVVKPQTPSIANFIRPTLEFGSIRYEPGKIMRHFIKVPKGATWAMLNLKLLGSGGPTGSDSNIQGSSARFVIHAMSVIGGEWCKSLEFYKMVQLQPMEETNLFFRVIESKVLELVVARWWAEPNESANLSATISFRSLTLNKPEVVFSAADALHKITVNNSFGTEDFAPAAVLKHQIQLLRPSDMKVVCLSEPRDSIPPGRVIYELQSTYNFSITRATEITLNCSLLSDTLYESAYESQLWMLFDANKRYLASGDAYPTKWNFKVEKGEYIARLHIRHEKREALDRFLTAGGNGNTTNLPWSGDTQIPALPVLLSMKLPSSITLDVFLTQYEVQDYKTPKKGSGWTAQLKKDSSVNAFISSSIPEKTLKTLPGTSTLYLQGTFTATKDENGKKLSTYPLKLCIPEPPAKTKSPSSASKDSSSDKTKLDEMNDQLRDVQISWLSKVTPQESRQLYSKLVESHDLHIPLHVARLQSLDNLPSLTAAETPTSDSENELVARSSDESLNGNGHGKGVEKKGEKKSVETYSEIISIADTILERVDRSALLAYFGTKPSATSSQVDAAKTKQNMEKQKTAVVEALAKKGCALVELYNLQTQPGSSSPDTSQTAINVTIEMIDDILFEVQKFAEITENRVVEFGVQHAISRGHYGRALRLMNKKMETDVTKGIAAGDALVLDLYRKLNWTHAVWMQTNQTLLKYPKDFRPF